jgi:hypothetical protein
MGERGPAAFFYGTLGLPFVLYLQLWLLYVEASFVPLCTSTHYIAVAESEAFVR